MPVNIPSFQPLRLIDVPDAGQELARLMQGTNNMMRTIASARAAQQRAAAAAARAAGQVETLSDGTKINVIGSTAKEKDASRKRILASLAEQRLLGNEKYKAYNDAIANASVERQGELLNDFLKNDAVNFAKDQPIEIQAAMQEYIDGVKKAYGERVENVTRAAGHAAGDVLSARTGQIAENLSSLGADTAQEMLESGARRDKLMRDVEENNAYIRNQMLREQEGAGFWERNFGGTGSAWTNIKRMAAENAPDFGIDIAGPMAGAATGAAIGSVVPVIGTATGATIGGILGTLGSAVLGGAEERGEYLSRAATRPDLTEQQRLDAVSGNAPWAAFAGGMALSALPGDTVASGIRRVIGREASDTARRGLWRQVGRDAAITGAEGAASMAAENTLQNALLSGSTGADIPLTENLADAMLGGAAIGIPLGVPRGIGNWRRNRPAATPQTPSNNTANTQTNTPVTPAGTSGNAFANAQAQAQGRQTQQTMQQATQQPSQPAAIDPARADRFRTFIQNVHDTRLDSDADDKTMDIIRDFINNGGTIDELDEIAANVSSTGKGITKSPFYAKSKYTAERIKRVLDAYKTNAAQQLQAPTSPVTPSVTLNENQQNFLNRVNVLANGLPSSSSSGPLLNGMNDPFVATIREALRGGSDISELRAAIDSMPDGQAKATLQGLLDGEQTSQTQIADEVTTRAVTALDPNQLVSMTDADLESSRNRLYDIHVNMPWLPAETKQKAYDAMILHDREMTRRRNDAQGQTSSTAGPQGGAVTPVVQPVSQGTAGPDGGNPPTDSGMATNPATDSAISPEGSTPEVIGDSGTVEGTGTGRTAVQSVRQSEGSEVDAEQAGTGRTDGTPNDDGGDNRLAPAAGTSENQSAGESGNQRVGDGSIDGDAETLGQRDLPDGESGVVPQNTEAPTDSSFKAVDADTVELDGPPTDGGNPYAARRNLFDNLQLYGEDSVRIPDVLHKVLSPKEKAPDLVSDIDKLESLLIREAIGETDRHSGFTNRDRAKLEKLRAEGIAFADPLPPVPADVLDTARKFRAGDPSVDVEGLIKAGLNPDESLSNTVLNYLCIR